MTDYTPQTSASKRYEAAREALAWYDDDSEAGGGVVLGGRAVADALRALITPPRVGEDEGQIADRVMKEQAFSPDDKLHMLVVAAVRAGIQSAHEAWEPADVPSQEQMLRWLGVTAEESVRDHDAYYIPEQYIEKEDV